MQKKIIALAVAGLVSGAVFAQAPGGAPGGRAPGGAPGGAPGAAAPSNNVTLYGCVDLAYVYSKSDYKKFSGIQSGESVGSTPSNIGVRGQESLGSGLRAIYLFEWGIMADEGASPGQHPLYGARNTWAGLAGNFGSVTLGRHEAPTMTYMGMTSPFFINGLKPTGQFRSKMTGLMGELRWSNSISYNSPNFSGVEFTGIYSFGEKTTSKTDAGYSCADIPANPPAPAHTDCYGSADTSDAGKLGLGVKYANGPLYLSAVYQQRADDDSLKPVTVNGNPVNVNTGYGAKGFAIGGAYDFKVVKLYANYFRQKANHSGLAYNNPARGSDKQSIWSLGITVPVSSAGTVFAEYAQYKDDLKCARAASCNGAVVANMGDKSKGYMIGYRHNLSRRTFLTAFVTRFDNDRGIDGGWSKTMLAGAASAADPGRSTGLVGEKQTIFVTGIVHNF